MTLLMYIHFIVTIILLKVYSTTANDPELIQQLWKQLYNQLPDPSFPSGQRRTVRLSVVVESVEFGHAYDDYLCRATLRLAASWPVADSRISESTLIHMVGGSVLLDADRVWRPQIVVPGARQITHFSRSLQLQSFTKPQLARPRLPPSLPSTVGDQDNEYTPDDPTTLDGGPSGKPVRRRGNQQASYVFSESFNVEVLCTTPGIKNFLGSIHCPIELKQETNYRINSHFVWQDRASCSLSKKAFEKLSYVTFSTKFSEKNNNEGGSQSNVAINLCFNPTGFVLRAAIPPFFFVILSFYLLWSLSCGLQIVSTAQGVLVLLTLITWSCTTGAMAKFSDSGASRFSLVDAWFLVCFVFIVVTFCFTLFEHRRIDRLLKMRQAQQQRRIYAAFSATKIPSVGGGGSGGSNCGCGGGCCSCTGYCGNSGNGFMLPGMINGQGNAMGGSSPPPPLGMMHQPSPVILPSKMELCNEAYLRSASCELSKDASAIMSMGTALRLRCAKNGGLGVFETHESNLGLIKSQYASSPQSCSSLLTPLNPLPPSYCTTALAVALPIFYLLATIIFWGSFGAQGTVPKECLTGSIICQAVEDL